MNFAATQLRRTDRLSKPRDRSPAVLKWQSAYAQLNRGKPSWANRNSSQAILRGKNRFERSEIGDLPDGFDRAALSFLEKVRELLC